MGVELGFFSRDGQVGFPGNLDVTVRYPLNNDNALAIHYVEMYTTEPGVQFYTGNFLLMEL